MTRRAAARRRPWRHAGGSACAAQVARRWRSIPAASSPYPWPTPRSTCLRHGLDGSWCLGAVLDGPSTRVGRQGAARSPGPSRRTASAPGRPLTHGPPPPPSRLRAAAPRPASSLTSPARKIWPRPGRARTATRPKCGGAAAMPSVVGWPCRGVPDGSLVGAGPRPLRRQSPARITAHARGGVRAASVRTSLAGSRLRRHPGTGFGPLWAGSPVLRPRPRRPHGLTQRATDALLPSARRTRAENRLRVWQLGLPARAPLEARVASVPARVPDDVEIRMVAGLSPMRQPAIDALRPVPPGGTGRPALATAGSSSRGHSGRGAPRQGARAVPPHVRRRGHRPPGPSSPTGALCGRPRHPRRGPRVASGSRDQAPGPHGVCPGGQAPDDPGSHGGPP